MKRLFLLICALFSVAAIFAQTTSPAVKARVVDAATHQAIEYADVVIADAENRTIASTAVRNGQFAIDKVRDGQFYLSILVVGYQPYTSKLLKFSQGESIDLGEIALQVVETGLKEVVVSGERSKIVYKLDRQRISGSASLSASGGTAVDVLKSAPSVRIDADGNLSFRGSTGVLVYVDGKPRM